MRKSIILAVNICLGYLAVLFSINLNAKDRQVPNNNKNLQHLNMYAIEPIRSFDKLDPSKILYAQEYTTLMNLISPLVSFDENRRIVSNLAKTFSWDGDKLIFTFDKDLKSSQGSPIGAEDAAISLKRILILASNTHGYLHKILCDGDKLTQISDPCAGIFVDDNKLILKAKGYNEFLLPMLAAIDFGIFPKDQIDLKNLKIKGFRDTTGPYSVGNYLKGRIPQFIANKNHPCYRSDMPQTVALINENDFPDLSYSDGFALFEAGKVDLIPGDAYIDTLRYAKFANQHSSSTNLRHSANFLVNMLYFTERGMKEFNAKERLGIGYLIKKSIQKNFVDEKYSLKETNQFFSELGSTKLNEKNVSLLSKAIDETAIEELPKALIFSVFREEQLSGIKNILESIKSLTVKMNMKEYYGTEYTGQADYPHIALVPTDTNFGEDISLLTYTHATNSFPPKYEDGEKFIEQYMNEENVEKRDAMLQDLHLEMLRSGKIIPLSSQPFFSVIRKPWKEDESYLKPVNGLWNIHFQTTKS